MAKEIWLGPLLGNNRSRLIQRCSDLVSEGKPESFLYLTASHQLLELVTEQILDGAKNRGLWGELPVYLFRGFVRRVIASSVNEETGKRLSPRTPIDREELPLKRSLLSQLLARLRTQGKLKAIAPLAGSDGCVNTIGKLVGEIARAARTPQELDEIVTARSKDDGEIAASVPLQIDFDREVALIYKHYSEALDRFNLTEEDADQLRALRILRGELDGDEFRAPWLSRVQLLVLDGFFDFTPVQGEMLRTLINQVPEVLVNLNHDVANEEIFKAFGETIQQLRGMAPFEVKQHVETAQVAGSLTPLRTNLFNPVSNAKSLPPPPLGEGGGFGAPGPSPLTPLPRGGQGTENIRVLECTDRETEIRAIAKEIKRLILEESYQPADIALVVRERESYTETISRVMREESIPCDLERRIETLQIPAIRAARKVFELLTELSSEPNGSVKVSALADLIKSEYFRLTDYDLEILGNRFEQQYAPLLAASNGDAPTTDLKREDWMRAQLGIGRWNADNLENVIAYVGAELRVTDWLARARRLLDKWPQVNATQKLAAPDPGNVKDEEVESRIEDADKIPPEERGEKKRRPSREVPPAAIAWASHVVERLSEIIKNVEREGKPIDLRLAVMRLLDQLQFYRQTRRPMHGPLDESELPHAMLDLRGLESLRRSFVAAIKSFEISEAVLPGKTLSSAVSLHSFLGEVTRCLGSQVQETTGLGKSGLRVLAATDIRGLRFRAVFVAGLVEGGFPLRASRDWIYPHEERERLKRFGLTLEDISPETLLKEEHYFYQVACRATERLYLLRPLLMEDGTDTVASYYIDELRRAVAPAEVPSEVVRHDFDGTELFSASTSAELCRSLVRQQERGRYSGGANSLLPAEALDGFVSWANSESFISTSALDRIGIERERTGRTFGRYDGRISQPELLAMLNSHFGSDFVHSASGLSMFGNCPYKFFASRVLKLEPRGEAALDLQALDAGKLLHDILRRFFEGHRRQQLRRGSMTELRAELAKVADDVFDEHESVVPPLNPNIWKLDREIRKILLDQVLLFELGVQEKTKQDMRPAHFEVAFGMTPRQPSDPISTPEPLELARSTAAREDRIKIQGQIDRVDVSDDQTLVAYDYKLSSGASREDMTAGRTFQVPIYLEALERLILPDHSIAGGGYYILRGGSSRRNKGIYRAAYAGYTGLQARNSVFADDEWQKIRDEVIAKIWEFLDHMRAGDFVMTPSEGKKTCRFCDFAAVCRYNRYRIQGKEDYPQITPIPQNEYTN
ncbi:MAG TPA: PD-(D/E)XK nuclease family protein [Pyrinomonadaceae bacterium]|nr:PD-(D/E)XK nuclease family protein [Pyrinomonadaceae bacterium]